MKFNKVNFDLPFFTYGVFRPGEIPFIGIKDFIHKVERFTVIGNVKIRDGIFIYSNEYDEDVEGYLIYFNPKKSKEAYTYINNLEPDSIFFWNEKINQDSIQFNLLEGKSPNKGSEFIENIDYSTIIDPYFTDGLKMLKEKDIPIFEWGFKSSFELQMMYMFLWTIIERFTFLRHSFGKNPNHRIQLLANNKYFILALSKFVNEERTVVSSKDLNIKTLQKNNSEQSIAYYYQVRSNLTHRGKGIIEDYELIKVCFDELLNITEFIINETINECATYKKKYGKQDF